METKTAILELRKRRHWSQDELAEKLAVTRQAVSRWENGETVPNTDTLKLMAQIFEVSVDYLLGREGRPEPSAGRAVTFDDFTYAMQNETRDLTDMDKQILLSMAKQLNDARKRKNGESG